MKKITILLLSLFLVCFFSSTVIFAADYPTKDIRTICPWGEGGGTDAINRMITKIAEKSLPVSIYVENIEGGASGTGVFEIMRARPDGYTIGTQTYDSIITVPRQKLVPGYDLDKLAFICRLTSEADALIVREDSRFQTFEDLVEAAKEEPGNINVAIQNLGSRTHLAGLMLEDEVGIDLNLVAYTGGAGPQKEALLSGEAEVAITSLGDFAPLLNSNQARGLVELSEKRNPKFTDVPTLIELGYNLQIGSFITVAAPAGTPDDILMKLEEIFDEAYHTDEFLNWLDDIGVTSAWLNSEETTQFVEETQTKFFEIMDMLVEQGIIEQ
ncbi:MAG: hypothetical protein XD76_1547 [candidate division TA06 bacterium 32_111]|jgi:tripartite-type tricarboxylate transporter receptor subunit TctC|nr:MAG: hypothetical protein XD76_1547 [candidate division TA06 bacterium 32_111]